MRLIVKSLTYFFLLSSFISLGYLFSDYFTISSLSNISSYMLNTVTYITLSTVISLVVGTLSAWYLTLYNVPYKKVFNVMYFLPMVFPTYIMSFIYSGHSGMSMLVFVTVLTSFPYVFMIMKSHIGSLTDNHMYTAMSLKMSDVVMKKDILFPLIKPGLIMSSVVLVADSLSEFGASFYYNVNTFTVALFEQWFTLYNTAQASIMSAIIMMFVLVVFSIKFKLIDWKNLVNPINSSVGTSPFTLSGLHKYIVMTVLTLPLVFSLAVPLWTINEWFILSYHNVEWISYLNTTLGTSVFALVVSTLSVLLSLLVSYLYKSSWGSNVLLAFNYSIPGIVLSIAMIHLGFSGYIALLWVFVLKYSMLPYSVISGQINKIDRRLYYSAKSLKKSSFWFVKNVQVPLSMNSIVLGFALVFVDVVRELPIMLTLRPVGFETLSTKIFYFYDSEMMYMSAPYIVLMMLITAPLLYLIRNK